MPLQNLPDDLEPVIDILREAPYSRSLNWLIHQVMCKPELHAKDVTAPICLTSDITSTKSGSRSAILSAAQEAHNAGFIKLGSILRTLAPDEPDTANNVFEYSKERCGSNIVFHAGAWPVKHWHPFSGRDNKEHEQEIFDCMDTLSFVTNLEHIAHYNPDTLETKCSIRIARYGMRQDEVAVFYSGGALRTYLPPTVQPKPKLSVGIYV